MEKKPNVVIIMADQLRYDVMEMGITPNIRKLADEGVEFTNCYCACPLCVPARGAFFTGTYPNHNGSLINPWAEVDRGYGSVKEGISNLYTMMEEDWDSIHSGKQHLYTEGTKLEDREDSKTYFAATDDIYFNHLKTEGKRKPGGPNFRTLVPEMTEGKFTRAVSYSTPETGCYEDGYENFYDGYYTEQGLKALKNRNREKPLLLNMMYLAPHPPFDIPQPWYSRFEEVNLPENVGEWYSRQSPLQMYNLTGVVGSRYSREEWEQPWKVYMGLVSLLDDCVGKIQDELKSQGIYDDSIIIFTSDHGEMLGSHKLFQKMCMYEESAKTPLYIKFPKGFKASRKVFDELVSGIDVFPTLCEYLNLKPAHEVDGQSLLPLIEGRETKLPRQEAYIQFDGNGARSNFQRCVVKDGYKLIVDLFKDETFLELYHVKEDRQEKVNLAFDEGYDQITEELLGLLKEHMVKTGDQIEILEICLKEFRDNYNRGFKR
ncbi:arylsulfatase [Clostridium sp. chh4-2]|uniref:sulfatase family protein n=1 Tax=Clostridium sp. chh4-2 TaxID=2067550 RepID=UPI000CCE7BD8|nr:sulfatase-like hydrolase/transferase [Clostridium sp. chh4-2]PNV62005.1 arylsulfatase [Clostridium sp. chh4-2]